MSKVYTGASMSLDGYVSGPDETGFEHLGDGIEAAIAKARELAGGKGVGLNSGTIASQALDAGLLDEVWIDLVPVLLGGGTPFFDGLQGAPVTLEGPLSNAGDADVTHLRYRVVRA